MEMPTALREDPAWGEGAGYKVIKNKHLPARVFLLQRLAHEVSREAAIGAVWRLSGAKCAAHQNSKIGTYGSQPK